MIIKHFIVTYKNAPLLEACVRSILATDVGPHHREIVIINNHSEFSLPDELNSKVKVLHNEARPDFSTGHLARNWNQALMHGFVSLEKPQADLVIACQNDCEFRANYLENVIDLHTRFDLVTHGDGDNCVSYSSQAVRQVGLWDERFCNIGFQEADYFLRAVKYLNHRCSINDSWHKRLFNPLENDLVTIKTVTGANRKDISNITSAKFHKFSEIVFNRKWMLSPENWDELDVNSIAEQIDSYILYPYFEKDIETLVEQRYIVP